MRALNIVALVMVVIMGIVMVFMFNEAEEIRWSSWNHDYGSYEYERAREERGSFTIFAASVTVLFLLFFTAVYILNIVKVKTTTAKVLSIIGLSFTFLGLLFSLIMFLDPRSATYDEAGLAYIPYLFVTLAFMIVCVIQAVKYHNKSTIQGRNETTIDDLAGF